MDGKQARRTGSSSPLGQLFDHGCDALAMLAHHQLSVIIFFLGPSYYTIYALLSMQFLF